MFTWIKKPFLILPRKQISFPKKSNLPLTRPKTPPLSKSNLLKSSWNRIFTWRCSEVRKILRCRRHWWWSSQRGRRLAIHTTSYTRLVREDLEAYGKWRTNSRNKYMLWKKYPRPSKLCFYFRVIMKKSVNSVINEKFLLDEMSNPFIINAIDSFQDR